ncbi:adult-specific rigid cuticular protein 15.5 [Rhipicephalus sanguineus]|nr:adult-specific rigid cuticular protein 15.5 [Rhipicephalus sanguineus]
MLLKILAVCAVSAAMVQGHLVRRAADDNDSNLPYTVNYDHTDEHGTRIYRLEITDADNVRMGTYGYMDAKGLYRQVHYLADATGFHVFVCTNEPGTETSFPADAVIQMHHWEKVAPDSTLGRLLARLPQVTSPTTVSADGKGQKKTAPQQDKKEKSG